MWGDFPEGPDLTRQALSESPTGGRRGRQTCTPSGLDKSRHLPGEQPGAPHGKICEQPLGTENGPWPTANTAMGTSVTQSQEVNSA